MTSALEAVYALLKSVWPTGATLLSPDDNTDFETALGAPGEARVVVRYWRPRLDRHQRPARLTAFADVCARTDALAGSEADKLLTALTRDARAPTAHSHATATPIRETSYHRVHVTWELITD